MLGLVLVIMNRAFNCLIDRLIDWLGINGTFSTNRLYCAFDKYVAVKKRN